MDSLSLLFNTSPKWASNSDLDGAVKLFRPCFVSTSPRGRRQSPGFSSSTQAIRSLGPLRGSCEVGFLGKLKHNPPKSFDSRAQPPLKDRCWPKLDDENSYVNNGDYMNPTIVQLGLSCSVAPIIFPSFFGGPTKSNLPTKKGSLFCQGQ